MMLFSNNVCLYINITALGMQHTINKVINDSYSGVVCDSYGSKLKYYKLAIGGDTKFTVLYVDFDISETHVANTNMEGGIRPPSYIETSHTHIHTHINMHLVIFLHRFEICNIGCWK